MYLLLILASISAMVALICILVIFAYKILRSEKNIISWFSLALIIFFLVIALRQAMRFLNWV